MPPFIGVICSFDFISCMSSREEALILSEKKCYVHLIFLSFIFWYFGHFSCMIFFRFFRLAHLALQNINKDYVMFVYFRIFVAKSDQKPKTKFGMNKTKVIFFLYEFYLVNMYI